MCVCIIEEAVLLFRTVHPKNNSDIEQQFVGSCCRSVCHRARREDECMMVWKGVRSSNDHARFLFQEENSTLSWRGH